MVSLQEVGHLLVEADLACHRVSLLVLIEIPSWLQSLDKINKLQILRKNRIQKKVKQLSLMKIRQEDLYPQARFQKLLTCSISYVGSVENHLMKIRMILWHCQQTLLMTLTCHLMGLGNLMKRTKRNLPLQFKNQLLQVKNCRSQINWLLKWTS